MNNLAMDLGSGYKWDDYPPMIEVYRLVDGRFALAAGYEERDTLRSPTFPELEIPLAGIFDFPVPPENPVTVVRESTPPYGGGFFSVGTPLRGVRRRIHATALFQHSRPRR
jgi:hypothetical protein